MTKVAVFSGTSILNFVIRSYLLLSRGRPTIHYRMLFLII